MHTYVHYTVMHTQTQLTYTHTHTQAHTHTHIIVNILTHNPPHIYFTDSHHHPVRVKPFQFERGASNINATLVNTRTIPKNYNNNPFKSK